MALSERLQFLISVNADGAIKGFQATGKAAEDGLGKAESKLDKIGSRLTKTGAGMMAFAGVAGVALFKAAQSASDLNEATSKTETVFGDAADAIKSFADDAAKSVGMSKVEALDAASTFGTLGKAAGLTGTDLASFSTDAATLAADLGSFHNTSAPEAIEAIGAALRGEAEPIRKYGVLLDDATLRQKALELGLISTTKEALTPAIKSQAAYAAVLEQTGDAQGDFARTSDGMANSAKTAAANLENAKAALGEGMAPILADVYGGVAKLAEGFVSLNEATGGAASKVASIGTIVIGVAGALSFAAGKAIQMRDSFAKMGTVGKVAVGGIAAGLVLYQAHAALAAKHSRQLADEIDNLGRAADDQLLQQFAETIVAGKFAGKDFEETLAEIARTSVGTLERIRELLEVSGEYTEETEAITEAIDNEIASQKQLQTDQARTTALTEQGTTATERATTATTRFATATETLKYKFEAAQRAYDSLIGSLDDQTAYLDVQDQFDALAQSAADAFTAASEGADDAEQKGRDYERSLIDTKKRVAEYASEVLGLPAERVTAILTDIDNGQLEAIERSLAILTRNRTVSVSIEAKGGAGYGPSFGGKRAHGGPTDRGMFYEVGEQGPEVLSEGGKTFLLPGSDGQVTPLAAVGASAGSAAGSPIYLTVNAGMGTDGALVGRQIVDTLNAELRRRGKAQL